MKRNEKRRFSLFKKKNEKKKIQSGRGYVHMTQTKKVVKCISANKRPFLNTESIEKVRIGSGQLTKWPVD